jgi:VanZ family protein
VRRALSLWGPPAAAAAVIFAFSAIPGGSAPGHPEWVDVLAHLAEFALLGSFLARALAGSRFGAEGPVALTIIFCVIYGLGDELHQLTVPARVFDPADLLADTIGAAAGAFLFRARAGRVSPPEPPPQPPATGSGGR